MQQTVVDLTDDDGAAFVSISVSLQEVVVSPWNGHPGSSMSFATEAYPGIERLREHYVRGAFGILSRKRDDESSVMLANNQPDPEFLMADLVEDGDAVRLYLYDAHMTRVDSYEEPEALTTNLLASPKTEHSARYMTLDTAQDNNMYRDLYLTVEQEDSIGAAVGLHSLLLRDILPGGRWAERWQTLLRRLGYST